MAEIYCCLLGHLQGLILFVLPQIHCKRDQNDRVETVKHGLSGLFRANEEQEAENTKMGKGVKVTGRMS